MFSKIETAQHAGEPAERFSPAFLRWLSAAAVITILLELYLTAHPATIADIFHSGTSQSAITHDIAALYPWRLASRLTVAGGVALAEGGAYIPPDTSVRWMNLTALLFVFVLVPATFLLSWRRLRVHDLTIEEERRPMNPFIPLGYGVGIALSAMLLLPAVVSTFEAENQQLASDRSMAESIERDGMVVDLNTIYYDAVQFKVLPQSMSGGGGSFAGYQIPAQLQRHGERTYNLVLASGARLEIRGTSGAYGGQVIGRVDGTGALQCEWQDLH